MDVTIVLKKFQHFRVTLGQQNIIFWHMFLFILILYVPDLILVILFILGSGGGWNSSLSLSANFSEIYPAYQNGVNRTQPTGFSSHWSWIGGWPCSPNSNQYGILMIFF